MIGLEKLNSNWNKNLIKDNIYNKMDKELKTRRIITGYNQITISGKQFQIGVTSIMAVEKVSCKAIKTGQELRNLGRCSWMLLPVKNIMIIRIITTYCSTASANTGGAYSKKL